MARLRLPVDFPRPVDVTYRPASRMWDVSVPFDTPLVAPVAELRASGCPIQIHDIIVMTTLAVGLDVTFFDDTGFYAYCYWGDNLAIDSCTVYAPGLPIGTVAGSPTRSTRPLSPCILMEGERMTVTLGLAGGMVGTITIHYEEIV